MAERDQKIIEIVKPHKAGTAGEGQRLEKHIFLDDSEAGRTARAERVHDLEQAVRRFDLALKSLENGYKFDDSSAKERLKLLRQALDTLTSEASILSEVYS